MKPERANIQLSAAAVDRVPTVIKMRANMHQPIILRSNRVFRSFHNRKSFRVGRGRRTCRSPRATGQERHAASLDVVTERKWDDLSMAGEQTGCIRRNDGAVGTREEGNSGERSRVTKEPMIACIHGMMDRARLQEWSQEKQARSVHCCSISRSR